MKKFTKKHLLTIILTATALLGGTLTAWGDELTVGAGSNTTEYSPFYGNYVDQNQRNQIVYAVSDLSAMSAMSGKNITSITFYQNNTNAWSGGFTISLAEISGTGFDSNAWFTDDLTQVFEGTVTGGSTVTVTFATPYYYEGGNLLIDIQTKTKSSNYKKSPFLGNTNLTTKKPAAYAYNNSVSSPYSTIWNLPKTTFTYENAAPVTCPKPTALTKGAVTASSATFSWTAGAGETSWQYCCLPAVTAVDWTDGTKVKTANSATAEVTGLTENTDYKFYVRAYCSSTDQSVETAVAFSTPCDAVASLASCGFEDVTTGSSVYNIPSCWNRIAYESSWYGTLPYVVNSSSSAHGGNNYLYFYGGSSTTSSIIVLPPISSPNTKAISFWYKHNDVNASYGKLQIGYMTDPTDASTFNELTNGTLDQVTTYTQVDGFLLSGMDPNAYIAIRFTGGSSAYGAAYLDDIEVFTPSSCTKPSGLSASAASATSATVSWTENGSATAWNVRFSTDESTWTTRAATTNPYTLTVPSANTTYYVQVQSNCGGETSGWTTSQTFTTPCAAQTGIGYTTGFESPSYSSGNYHLPDCWNRISTSNYPYNYSYYARSGSQCLYFYGGRKTAPQIAVLPPFSEDINTLMISLYYQNGTSYSSYTGASYGSLEVGYITDPKDSTTFGLVEKLDKISSYGSIAKSVSISGAPSGAYIALRYTGGTSDGVVCVDDITIIKTPTCFKPASVTVNSSTYNGVNFSWTESGHGETQWQYAVVAAGTTPSSWSDATSTKSASVSGLTTGSSYEVCVRSYCGASDQSELTRSASFIPTCQAPSGVTVSAITNSSASVNWTANNGESTWNLQYRKGTGSWTTKSNITKPYALTGLDANSTYEVKVACAEGCTSGYSTAASFKTKCDAIAEAELPYENNFESATTYKLPSCWDKIGSGDYPQVLSGSAAYGGSGKCLGFYGNSTQTAILPGFETAINKLMITFHYRHSNSDVQIGYVKANGDFVPKETLPTRSAYNEVSPYEVEMSDWGDEAVYIAFCMANTTSSYANAYIDNVKVEKAPTCFKPAGWDNANTTIGANSATIAWTAPAKNESQYQYICVPSGETPDWDSEDAHLTSSRNATIDNLQPASAYDFYVRSYCAADDQSEIISKSFSTTCGTFTLTDDSPFEYDFEGGTWGQTPTCWTTHYASGYHAYFSNGSAHTGSKALDVLASKNTGSETFVVLPKLSMALNKLAISFYYKGTAGATIQVGYMTDKDNKGTFTAVGAALTASASYQLGAVSFASVSADAYIAIRFKGNTGDGDFYIDDVRVARTELFTDGEDNFQTRLTGLADQTLDVLMTRPLQFDGYYSTLCLPFDLSAEQLADADCPLYNFTIKYFDYVEVQNEELIISIAPTGTITAGVPYFVMANAASYDKPLLFRDVTISAATPAYKVSEGVKYQGVFNNVGLAAQTENDTHDIIYLGRGNQLYWPDAAVTVKGFRAYFNADTSGPNNSPIHRGMKLSFGEGHGTTTAIERIGTDADGVRKVLENGRIIIIRDGKRYSVMGQVIE